MELILLILLIYILVTVVIPIIIAMSKIAIVITAGIAFFVGFSSAVTNYLFAIRNNLNFLYWDWKKDVEPARRSYFFGPGYVQLYYTIENAFRLNAASGVKIIVTGSSFKGSSTGIWGVIKAFGGFIYVMVGFVCIFVIGTILCAILGLVHGSVTTIFMIFTYVIFTIVWIIDRIYLIKNKIRSDCPVCHSRFLIPTFMCPNCGAIHKKLVPGLYGIWKHKCTCGKKISSTFLNGRSKLDAFCPDCGSRLVASDARQIVFQLIGGTNAGKTAYLSAFFHEYMKKLSNNKILKYTIEDQYKPYFDELEEWYKGVYCPATAQLNSQMYPLLIASSLKVKRQFSIYDIGGEMFDGFTADAEIQQQQFRYCNGFLFLIDPFSGGNLRMNKINAGEDISTFNDMAIENIATSFINYLIRIGHAKADSLCNIPIAILITKSDIKEIKQKIGPAKINNILRKNPEKYNTYEEARNNICREFLIDNGFSATVGELETKFSNFQYFSVSAIGHLADATPYEPWGVIDPIEWMLSLADKELSDLITPPTVAN